LSVRLLLLDKQEHSCESTFVISSAVFFLLTPMPRN
jgi:hypothetical protein